MDQERDASAADPTGSGIAEEVVAGGAGMPRQLGDGDAVFVAVESPEAPSHVAGLTILDPSSSSFFESESQSESGDRFGFDLFLEILSERIALVDRFRWRLMELPFGIDRAYWVEAEDFDIRDHVHRIALPAPADRAALGELAGLLHSRTLDRKRPLWECWWIEGLEGGRVATLIKFHHCLMDGESGMGLSEILMDLGPEPARHPEPPQALRESAPRRPGLFEIARGAILHGAARPQRMAVHARRALREGLTRMTGTPAAGAPPPVPRVPFNDRLSCRRSFAFASIPLAPIREAKKHFDVKVNDVLLEIVSSSLRFGLAQRGELPDSSIVALCPVSLRGEGDPRFGNQISSMPVSLATHLADPASRLTAIAESAKAAKQRLAGGAFETLTALGECFVPGALRALTRAAHAFPSLLPLPANLVFSNVRGLPVPTYLAGARVEELYPMSMLQVANGMNVTAVSHDDQVDFGFLVDSKLIPDPWIYAEGVERALRELEEVVASRSRMPPASARNTSPSRADAVPVEDEDEPLDLHLIIGQLSHIRAPSRSGIGRPAPEDPRDSEDSEGEGARER